MPRATQPPLHLSTPAGQPLTIALSGNAGGGWLWQAPDTPAGCQLTEAATAGTGAGEGGAVQQQFVFSSAAPGAYPLRFEQRRPWDSTAQPAQAVQMVHVQVT